ncbi:uncharacterized protein LOC122278690 [Carya illinoinensis]|uniref:uncharacterized protein LOC122278690 n=1 Tax=Carya illinoinensis TaxID=32201 RepID=UPI001C71DA77|nr:uncharacterized protein LOC122278690 [Carya illinoinensis]
MRLNPAKCAYRVQSEKVLGFIVSERGIEASPNKIKAILNMKPPKNLNETQRLAGRVASLRRFISRSTYKCLPFFQVLWKVHPWNEQCDEAFKKLKVYLASPPLLKQPEQGDVLYAYLAVSLNAVSTVLVKEGEAAQHRVYYVSRALKGAEARYPQIELLAFALVTVAKKLQPYFQAHTVRVLMETPLAKVLKKWDSTGRLIGWSIELSKFDLEYEPRKAFRGQSLANFVAEFSKFPQEETIEPSEKSWVLFIDGSSCREGGGLGVHLLSTNGKGRHYMATLAFKVTNNEALIAGLFVAAQMGVKEIEARSDSQVVVNQVLGLYATKEWGSKIMEYLEEGKLPEIKDEARRVKKKVTRFQLIDGVLYKRGFSTPLLRCISTQEAQYVLAEIHEGICGNHSGRRTLARKVVRAGYYWPNALKDAREFSKKCVKCQTFKIPQSLITDNGRQFNSDHYKEWCAELKIKAKYSSPGHPQANGQAEPTNKALLSILKKKVAETKGEWQTSCQVYFGRTELQQKL